MLPLKGAQALFVLPLNANVGILGPWIRRAERALRNTSPPITTRPNPNHSCWGTSRYTYRYTYRYMTFQYPTYPRTSTLPAVLAIESEPRMATSNVAQRDVTLQRRDVTPYDFFWLNKATATPDLVRLHRDPALRHA